MQNVILAPKSKSINQLLSIVLFYVILQIIKL